MKKITIKKKRYQLYFINLAEDNKKILQKKKENFS